MVPGASLFLGLISGTSADGIDAALVEFGDQPKLIAAKTFAYPVALRAEVLGLSQHDGTISLDRFGELDRLIGLAFAQAADSLLVEAAIDRGMVVAIGSHGQTLRHRPARAMPFTLQLGDPNLIAERNGIAVVADFRRRDVAAGGQGAPLVPAFHAAVLRVPGEDRAVLNLGGIANLSLLPAQGPVLGFDTGPGNGLLDAWCMQQQGTTFDQNGAFAASGRVDPSLLKTLLNDPYFDRPLPKSTGRDYFHLEWLRTALSRHATQPADVQATLVELTVESITRALQGCQPSTTRLVLCGGGVHNGHLRMRLKQRLANIAVLSSAEHGIDPDFMEAMAFAWLARETLANRPGNLPEVTGARGPRVLGAIYSA